MTSTLNDNSSTNNMDRIVKEQVIEMFKKGFTYQQVSDELKERYPKETDFFVSSVKLFCSENDISSRSSNHFVVETSLSCLLIQLTNYTFFL